MKITISGTAGTSKSTVRKVLAEKYHLEARSVGDLFRDIAIQRGITFQELDVLAGHDTSIDIDLDQGTVDFARTHDNYVIEGRRVMLLTPEATHILLTCDDEVRFERIARRDNISVTEARRRTLLREKKAGERYEKIYGHDFTSIFDPKRFDFVLDTTKLTPDQVIERITHFIDSIK